MSIKILNRSFVFDGNTLPDPNPELSVLEVQKMYANTYPEIVLSNPIETITDNEIIVEFKKKGGQLG